MIDRNELKSFYHECMPIFIALGDEVRLNIIEILTHQLALNNPDGLSVNEITEQMCLSRPAVSHHLKILKDSGLVDVKRDGTSNLYHLTMDDCTLNLIKLASMSREYYGY
jgi:DNA-binding transcriptional ArsR family regulator